MAQGTGIEWTDATWNPIAGCNDVSEGCRNCYARAMAGRLEAMGQAKYSGLTVLQGSHRVWTGKVSFDEKMLLDPLKWKRPRRIFVNSMSDLFHENVTDEMRDKIWAVMALCPQHEFQILTKRPITMHAYLSDRADRDVETIVLRLAMTMGFVQVPMPWPLPNVRLGVSTENQKAADERLDFLCGLALQGWKTMVSFEPLLGAVDPGKRWLSLGPRTWAIVGGESGAGARPMHPDWARSLRDQCKAAGVPFFFKQWGEWEWGEPVYWSATPELAGKVYGPFRPTCVGDGGDRRIMCRAYPAVIPGRIGEDDRSFVWIWESRRARNKAAGALLDGVEYREFPA